MSDTLVWLHPEALRCHHPAALEAPPQTTLVFVWDEELFREMDMSLKRLVFLYESVLSIVTSLSQDSTEARPFLALQGRTVDVLAERQPREILIPDTINPVILARAKALSTRFSVKMVADHPFADVPADRDWRKFFDYWKHAEKSCFFENGTPSLVK